LTVIESIGRFLTMLRNSAPMRFWALVGASIILTFMAAWLVCIISYGAWPPMQAARRLDILGKALWFTLFMVLVVVASLTLSKISAKAGTASFDIGHDGEDKPEPPPAVVTTTTRTEVQQ
jgi:hypothetical protein